MMFKKIILAGVLAAVGAAASATNYFVVVPVKGKTETASTIQVALTPSSLPAAQVGAPFSYDFGANLVVTGDAQFKGAGVAWTVDSDLLPPGLSVDPLSGVLRGTPTAPGTSSFSVIAAYKSKTGQQTYALTVAGAARFTVAAGTPTSLALVGTAMGAASAPSVIQLKNSGNYSGSLPLPDFGGAAAQFNSSTTCTNVPANGSCAVAVTWTPAASQATASLVLDGTTYTFNGNMKQFATWDPANTGTGYNLSNNNLTVTNRTGSLYGGARATVGKSSGKWYWEVTADGMGLNELIGIAKSSFPTKSDRMCFGCDTSSSAQSQWRAVYPSSRSQTAWTAPTTSNFAGTTLATTGAAYGDTYGFALDADAQILTIYYTPVGGSCVNHSIMQWTNIGAATWYPTVSTGGQTWVVTANFGAAAFKCPVPPGYQVL
jgi:hypothetical protein